MIFKVNSFCSQPFYLARVGITVGFSDKWSDTLVYPGKSSFMIGINMAVVSSMIGGSFIYSCSAQFLLKSIVFMICEHEYINMNSPLQP